MQSGDLIAAIATPGGAGGIGIVRVSGGTLHALTAMLSGEGLPPPRQATRRRFIDEDGGVIDDGLALYFPAPHSFTGEEVLELHAHGGRFVLQRLLSRCYQLGARPAEAGEFTLRAYLNEKLDLAQAEALADLINAGSAAAAKAAARSLTGEFSALVTQFIQRLRAVRIRLEGDLDFNEEDAQTPDAKAAKRDMDDLLEPLTALIARAQQGALLVSGAEAVIIGAPNVGKSSLLNRLAQEEAAIVSRQPGTTRDLIERSLVIEGLSLRVTDTAGLRENAQAVEQEGMRRARLRMQQADVILCIATADIPFPPSLDAEEEKVIRIVNKIDLSGEAAGEASGIHYISAKTGAGVDALCRALCDKLGYVPDASVFSVRARHIAALQAAHRHLARAAAETLPEVAAAWLREADLQLQHITGGYDEEDLLGDIFSAFCIGK